MVVLVTGACGQLGSELRRLCASSTHSFIFSDVVPSEGVISLDITDIRELRRVVSENGVEAIVNCAAYTNVDAAESNAELAGKLNSEAPALLAQVMKECKGLLVHISTDYVFGVTPLREPLSEDVPAAPCSVYGQTKYDGEMAIARSGCRSIIIRTAWLYSEFGKNFCKTIMRLSSEKPEIRVVDDQRGTPTYAADLAEAILKALDNPVCGLYHYSNEGECTWFEFASAIVRLCGNHSCSVLPCTSMEYPSPVRRPEYSVLDKTRIKEVFSLDIPRWEDSLEKCLENMKTV